MIAKGALSRLPALWVTPILLVIVAACGDSTDTPMPQESVSARVIVTDVQVSADGKRVESITVLTEDGEELKMRMGDEIEPAIWGPSHLLSHADLGNSLGLKIGVTYVYKPESVVATQLSE